MCDRCPRLLSLLLLLLSLGFVAGEDEIYLEGLKSADFSQRQATTRRLWNARATHRDAVESAARDPDPEVAARARWILERWREGSLPDTPPDVLRRLRSSSGVERLEGLLDAGLFEAVVIAVEQAVGTLEGPQLRMELSESLARRFAFYTRTAIETDQLALLLRLLDIATENPTLAVARAKLLQLLDYDLAQVDLLPVAANGWPQRERQRTLVLVHAALDDLAQALATAREYGQEDMVRACHLLLGNWEQLLTESLAEAEAAPPGSVAAFRGWADVMVAARRASDTALADRAAEELARVVNDSDARAAVQWRWRCLLIHGYVEPAVEILKASSPADAAEVLSYLGRFGEAFEVLGVDPRQINASVESQLQQLRAELNAHRSHARGEPPDQATFEHLLTTGKLLLRLGEREHARRLFERIAALDPGTVENANRFQVSQEFRTRRQVVSALWQMGRTDWAIDLSAPQNQQAVSPEILIDCLRRMAGFGDDERLRAVVSLREAILKLYPQLDQRQHLRMVHAITRGDSPWEENADAKFAELFEQLQTNKPKVRRVNGRLEITGRGYTNAALGDLFLQAGQTDAGQQVLGQLTALGDSGAELRLADLELAAGNAATALERYRRVWIRHSDFQMQRRESNSADSELLLAMKAMLGEIISIERLGDDPEASKQRKLLRLMLSGSSLAAKKDFAEHLAEWGESDLAELTLSGMLRLTAFGADDTVDFARVASAQGRLLIDSDPAESARWSDLSLAGTLESMAYYPRGYLILPAQYHALDAVAAAQRHDADAVRYHLQESLKLYPMNITLAEDTLKTIRDAGYVDVADETFDSIFSVGRKHLTVFPNDAQTSNNLAWVAALNDRNLEEALQLSKHAVWLEPDSVSYRDTLAEILFRRGRVEEALVIEQHCLLDEPNQWHLHEQIGKFKSALAADP